MSKINKHLTNAANAIIEKAVSPIKFLEFLHNLTYVHLKYCPDSHKQGEGYFFPTELSEIILIKWMEKPNNPCEHLAISLREFADDNGWDHLNNEFKRCLFSYTQANSGDEGTFSIDIHRNMMNVFYGLDKAFSHLLEWEKEQDAKKVVTTP